MNNFYQKLYSSFLNYNGNVNSIEEILAKIDQRNKNLVVNINKINLGKDGFWFYDDAASMIRNKNNSFFQIRGIKKGNLQQPVIIQDEIGYLGIIVKEIDGVLNFLMQLKIEPGNVNKIQISPTIQATKSNFTQKHGGRKPNYLDYFVNAKKEDIIVDQIQSEQSSRFCSKRNRNIVIVTDEDVDVLDDFMWMTLGQIKELMKYDNLVNMDSRTVISQIPYSFANLSPDELKDIKSEAADSALINSIFSDDYMIEMKTVYNYINDYKMFDAKPSRIVRLDELDKWQIKDNEIVCEDDYHFKVIFCDIEIEGREVRNWQQPLCEANGIATFGLICADFDGETKFLVKAVDEIGCFDSVELGPTIQHEANHHEKPDAAEQIFFDLAKDASKVAYNVILSEEGGRFYNEENKNIVIKASKDDFTTLPKGYFWVSFACINHMIQINNCVNIQLRNLLALLEI